MESNMSRLDKSLKDMLDFSLSAFIPRFQLGKDYAPFLWAWASGASERYLVTDSSDLRVRLVLMRLSRLPSVKVL